MRGHIGEFDWAQTDVLVTGGGGFLGAHVCRRLSERDARSVFIARSRDFDLTDPRAAERLFDVSRPDVVFHLAAEVGGIGANQESPGRFIYANLTMGANVIEQARRSGVEKLVQVGTVCSYPKLAEVPFREEDLWSGYPEETNAPYGVAKRAVLVMLGAYRQQYGLDGISVIPTNLYGPGDDFDLRTSHVIPALIQKCEAARRDARRAVECWGSGQATRDFLFVEDAAEALVVAAERYEGSDPVNIGSGREVSIAELARMVAEATGFDGEIVWDRSRPDGQPRRAVDAARAAATLGFVPQVGLREGLRRTVAWFRDTLAVEATGRAQQSDLSRSATP